MKKPKEVDNRTFPVLQLDRPVPDSASCFCAGIVWKIGEHRFSGKLAIQFAWIPYKMNGTGMYQVKLAGGMGKKSESPIRIAKRELMEELGISVAEEELMYVYGISSDYHTHAKMFFLVTSPKPHLREDEYDAETGKPEWAEYEWLAGTQGTQDIKGKLFGMHATGFSYAVQKLATLIQEEENPEEMIAALNAGILPANNRVKGLLRREALKDSDFAMRYGDELADVIG